MSPAPRPRVTAAGIAIAVALTFAVLLALTGCSDSDPGGAEGDRTPAADSAPADSSPTAPEGDSNLGPAGEALATVSGDEDMVARIMDVERESGILTVKAVLENTGDEDFLAVGWKDRPGLRPYTLAGSYFHDKASKTLHWPIFGKSTKKCLCTEQIGTIEAGSKVDVEVSFPDVLKSVAKVSLNLATFPQVDIDIPEGN